MTRLSDHLHRAGEGTCDLRYELNRSLTQIRRKNDFYHAIKDFSVAETQEIKPGPLAGATVVVKDNIHVEGYPTCAGTASPLPDGFLKECSLVTKISELGGAIVGKGHCAELSLGGTGLNIIQGTPRNPHDNKVHRAPGGSSSGPAVAVATDMAMIGLCTDTGGSARVPASVCGLVGYRPSEGVFPDDGILKLGMPDRIGVIGKTVADVRLFSDIVSAVNLTKTEPTPKAIKTFPVELLQELPADHLSRYLLTIQELSNAGHSVSELDPKFLIEIFSQLENAQVDKLGASELAIFLDANLPEYQLDVSQRIGEMLQKGRENSAEAVQGILDFIVKFATQKASELFLATDFLVTPTLPVPPPPIESLLSDEGYEAYSDLMLKFTIIGTLFRGAAITVPSGFDNDSLPVGFQIIAPSGSDRDLFSIASSIEGFHAEKSEETSRRMKGK